ncbi:MAG: GNAT family N-acetyltransferase [Actinomycetota bacterium]|nr:GNAT family N-acetyltransferase [Actinomycetota bacterium]
MLLRKITADTIDEFTELLVELDRDPEVMRHLTGIPTPRPEIVDVLIPQVLAEDRTHPQFGRWLAFDHNDNSFLGRFSLRLSVPQDRPGTVSPADEATLGYRLRRRAWGRGLATEGTIALIHRAFDDLGLRRVWAETMFVNTRSRGVMERSGLTYLRTFHVHFDDPLPGTELGEVEYQAFADSWQP